MAIAALTTLLALTLTIADYENFLILLGAVFVPMSAVLIVDFFVLARGRWDMSPEAPSRWLMALKWAWVDRQLHFTPASWMSASILSFVVAALVTLGIGWRRR